ncbi:MULTISPECIES: restriction endonuclease subunit S [Pseudoalteromonas]|uniref:restriction endonuclease subunit S n=1 Tax=Pseudoalteromonas TaxID=53246 RepID=UPI001F0FD576|nr:MULTISPECIES: restriction endonuclease subunit S [Pseudoalteromonas]MDC9565406.1 restriction endonuclease subunit S [Pseudoalteromonas sp. GAB2316C]MDC9569739.1 restriction endonuclease subunit S [Pseudoalteromonas sp. GABNB9D]MDC9574779.1 restriction endonuclease subunit S [Pseudoalteromonas sp. GABNS16A]MDC9578213.1 restriction endonuclease subunit S [Pseudoalteromonas sp. GABNS16E]MDC9585863.1 restriction endonuclease subunit S [Pseudoalteromonas sp. GABNS16C]|tara:strand:- start:153 stop:1340 length:1188 start_codon:yes stop_codon:yes gene_type:complete
MEGWRKKKIGDFLTLEYGKPLDKVKRKVDGLYPAYGANGVKCRSDEFYFDKKTIIVGRKGSAGEITLTEEKFWPLDVTYFVNFDATKYDLMFIYHLLSRLDLPSLATGVKPGINRNNVYSISVQIPEIKEQKCIVAILEQAFADIEQARAKTEQNLKNARELFESYLQQVFSQRGKKVQSVELGDVVDVLTDYHANGSYKVLKQHVELKEQEDFAWMVRSTDFEKKFKNEKRYITEHAYNYLTKSKLFGGEIIMSKIGNAGKVYFMPETDRPCSLAMNLFLIRLDPSKANNEYIYRYLNSSSGKAQIAPRLKGAATQTITKDNVRSLQIPMPSLDGQHEVIKNLKILEKEIESLESLYMKKLTNIEELKKSILQKAFSGKLTKTLEVDTNKGAVA